MTIDKKERRIRRHLRVRAKIFGTAERPRLSVFRSNRHIHLQVINDSAQKTLISASTKEAVIAKESAARIKEAVRLLSDRMQKAGIKQLVFDRGGYKYHGKVKLVAEAAREMGLKI